MSPPKGQQRTLPTLEIPGIPDFRDGIAQWNAAWEAQFPILNLTCGNLEALASGIKDTPMDAQELLDIQRNLCLLQEEMRGVALTSVLQPDFCWKTFTSPSEREAHMLEGFMRTCLNSPECAPSMRMYTGDITLATLETDSGEGFLALLRKYVPDGDVDLTKGGVISYLHPGWTRESISRLQEVGRPRLVAEALITSRDHFLCCFLNNTICSVIGPARPPEIVIKHDGIHTTTLDWAVLPKRPTKKTLNNESPNAVPVYRRGRSCDGCRNRESNGRRFLICKKCNEKISRQVYYCSRACQIAHWPNHKKVCGKELPLAVVQNPTVYTQDSLAQAVFLLRRIGPARDGYTRSPALVRQILYLDVVPSCEYAFFSPTGPRPMQIQKFLSRLVFRLAAQTAMTAGDPDCGRGIRQCRGDRS
ncbi:hypothetical protein K438DRAFT_1774584 [Mycena galopus ATCC 62051]|nr:hypothetical protein K438DRAFT_1774584 [Mycena galopus ATCC 62051]